MADRLQIWLGKVPVAVVTRKAKRLRLTYTKEAFASFPAGTPLLSANLPLADRDYPNGQTAAFLDGLLPEGESRRAAAERFDVQASDTFGLLAALGRDCAGALVIQPADGPPPQRPTVQRAQVLEEREVARLIANLRTAPLGIDLGVRVSLAGVQEKLLLTRMHDGRWGRPVEGSASTHILKPTHPAFPDSVANEAFCMRLAHQMGLPTAEVETTRFGSREVLVVKRYDRTINADGSIERLHQEDFCQALGIPPSKKYEDQGGPSLEGLARMLAVLTGASSLATLLRAVTLNVLVGNADAHGKNFALLHLPTGRIEPAPFYDIMSTQIYKDLDARMAMYVDSVQRLDRVTAAKLVNEGSSWGLSRELAGAAVDEFNADLPRALDKAIGDVPNTPDSLIKNIQRQVKRVLG